MSTSKWPKISSSTLCTENTPGKWTFCFGVVEDHEHRHREETMFYFLICWCTSWDRSILGANIGPFSNTVVSLECYIKSVQLNWRIEIMTCNTEPRRLNCFKRACMSSGYMQLRIAKDVAQWKLTNLFKTLQNCIAIYLFDFCVWLCSPGVKILQLRALCCKVSGWRQHLGLPSKSQMGSNTCFSGERDHCLEEEL